MYWQKLKWNPTWCCSKSLNSWVLQTFMILFFTSNLLHTLTQLKHLIMKWLKSRQTTNFDWEPSFKRYFCLSIHSVILELNNFYKLEPFCERTLLWWFLIRNYDNTIIGNDDVFIIPGLDQQTFYHVRARSRNKAGLSDPSNIIYLKTNGEIPYQAKIGQPSPAGSIHCGIYLPSFAALVLALSW